MVLWLDAASAREQQDSLLELLNSTPVVNGAPTDQFVDIEASGEWQRAHGGTGTAEERGHLVAARDALQAAVWGKESQPPLSALLDGVRQYPHVTSSGLTWVLEVPEQRRLAVECVLVWSELSQDLPGRLRPCGNPDCQRFLIDRSKANTARWCSMAVCGNRMKARRHHERTRDERTRAATGR